MRISELSAASGVPVATIKYYLREGMLAAGEKSSATQADYSEAHVARLRLIRAFIDIAGLSIASAREVLAAVDDEGLHFGYAAAIASRALPTPSASTDPGAEELIDEVVAARRWCVSAENPGRALAARVVSDYRALGRDDLLATIDVYAEAAERVAAADLQAVAAASGRPAMAETVVIGTVLGDSLFSGLRRMAHEDASASRFPITAPTDIQPKDA
ncbi:MerR family transcriptional regulator [Salinibacterium sp. SYSU T00001]|uniref:MerR family transcriptional regulator n=1 Tax=Homoserinimonas sedimenticola TaxID=2986805 RepID=UPI002236A928|nr:MerR family transcriptional regulator [Salinibacterium sedimenticola]MCW4385498.1 MerR family transcriptional regulator [Salinibacterium sedimenticola]